MSSENRNKLQRLSFLLSIFVIIIHATNFRVYGFYSGILYQTEFFIETVANFAVPTFFAISGYLFFRSYEPKQAKRKLKTRFKTIFIPYLIWGSFYCILFSALPHVPIIGRYINQRTTIPEAALNTFVRAENTHLWYLRNLVIYLLLAPILYYLIRFRYSLPAYIVTVFVLHSRVFSEGSNSILIYSMYFYGGGWAALHLKRYVERDFSRKQRTIACAVLGFIWIANRILAGKADISYLFYLLGIPFIWIFADCLKKTEPVHDFIKSSFFIYVSHVFILECIEKMFYVLLPHSQIGAFTEYVIVPVLTLIVIYLSEKVLHKNIRLWNLLTGSRG